MAFYNVVHREEYGMSPTSATSSSQVSLNGTWRDESPHPYRDDPRMSDQFSLKPNPNYAYSPSPLHSQGDQSTRRYSKQKSKKRRIRWLLILGVVICLGAAGAIVGYILTKKSSHQTKAAGSDSGNNTSTAGGTSNSTGTGTSGKGNVAIAGTTGSQVTLEDGSTFVYQNDFGGDWAFDPTQPFAPGGKAQSWSPRVGSEEWVWGTDVIRGVNFGGWLVTEPFVVPALYEEYVGKTSIEIVDEWTLSQAMGADLPTKMENHYKTFITEQDFAQVAAAGLNWVRIPLGFWAIETINDEPLLPGVSWKYFLKAIEWARKYGIRIYLDFHALPGSQNGWNHSGKNGEINVMYGVMGLANAERSMTYMRILVEFASQPQYKDVIGLVGLVNEIQIAIIGQASVQSFYFESYQTIRNATGLGAGNGPVLVIHDGFEGPAAWAGFLSGADRIAIDQHPYLAFMGDTTSTPDQLAVKPCAWAMATNQSSKVFGITVGGEFSVALNNCGLWVNGMGVNNLPGCEVWDNWQQYTPALKNSLKNVALASMDALQNFFFWTWKIGNSTVLGTSSSPMWHYQLGLQQGWIPKDPREAIGHCASVLGASQPFDGKYPATATGGVGAGTIDPVQIASHTYPPATILPSFSGTQIGLLPTYTPTGALKTLPVPTFTAAPTVNAGTGWTFAADTIPAWVPIVGCPYPDPWNAANATLPTTTCSGP